MRYLPGGLDTGQSGDVKVQMIKNQIIDDTKVNICRTDLG
jgi:hypothetical protein